jgi:hypothetical protein
MCSKPRTDAVGAAMRFVTTAAMTADDTRTYGQLWNIGPAHRPQWTVLDGVPTPTDL